MSHYLNGLLTALKNTAIAMTVTDAYDSKPEEGSDELETTTVTAIYVANGVVQTVQLDADHFVGFGDYLIFEDGVFTEAGVHPTDDEDDEEEEEEDEDEPDAPTV